MKLNKNIKIYALILGCFLVCATVGMLIEPAAFAKFFSPVQLIRNPPPQLPDKSYYWDVEHYASLALNLRCTAFYPLWPAILKFLFHPQNLEQAAAQASLLATGLFLLTTPLFYHVLKKAFQDNYLALIISIAFAVNPMAIFRVNGYTEGLFTLLTVVLMWVFWQQQLTLRLVSLFSVTFLMALTRPVLFQILVASSLTWLTLFLLKKATRQHLYQTLAIAGGAILGYSIYGNFCLQTRGNFWATFQDQKLWGKSLGLHLDLLLFPKSLLFDLLGLYFPFFLLVLALFFVYCQKQQQTPQIIIPQFWGWNILLVYPPALVIVYGGNWLKAKFLKTNHFQAFQLSPTSSNLAANYLFWFSTYYCVVHCLIVFLTQNRLFSLGRFIFAVPFFFLSLGYIYLAIPGTKKYRSLWWMIIVSAVALILQWVTYGKDGWLG